VEVGTYTGLSALTMKQFLTETGRLVTFDITPWDRIDDTCFQREDFSDGRLVQEIGDLSDPDFMRQHESLLASADLLFVDAPKDGVFEPRFLAALARIHFTQPLLVILDDIRFWNMIELWSSLQFPKLDVTSFGHWSGTGLIRWKTPETRST